MISFSQISPGDLSSPHAYLEGVENCTKCHDAGKNVSNTKCLDCHKEITIKQKRNEGYHASKEVRTKNCYACHNEHHGRKFDINRFDTLNFKHELTGFKLQGQHAKVSCSDCHHTKFIKNPKLKKNPDTFLGLEKKCTSCHPDFHQSKLGSDCATCHGFNSFENPKSYDHSKTRFPLKGKHKTVSCDECHRTINKGKVKVQNFEKMKFANCNDCHRDPHQNKFGQDCKSCHEETSFKVVRNKGNFNHNLTDFPLEGNHVSLDCKQCHKSGDMTKALAHASCSDCHKDYHEGQFTKNNIKSDCKECHTTSGFEVGTYTLEQHNKSDFPLNAAHQATACVDCHLKGDKWNFRNIGEKCVDCHTNEHKGYISEKYMPDDDCSQCHNEDNWKQVKFDHNKTQFKLDNKHADTSCSQCHYPLDNSGKKNQRFHGMTTECVSCHEDHHVGQFASENGKTDCLLCHTTLNWNPDKFDHNTTRFKLDGHHAKVDCDKCHKETSNEKGVFIAHRFDDISCASCHN